MQAKRNTVSQRDDDEPQNKVWELKKEETKTRQTAKKTKWMITLQDISNVEEMPSNNWEIQKHIQLQTQWNYNLDVQVEFILY